MMTISVDSQRPNDQDDFSLILQQSRRWFKKADQRPNLLMKFGGLLVKKWSASD
jgi:hypothetical protein